MRSILLHVDGHSDMESRLQVTLELARELDAHLTCFQPVSYEFAVPGDIYGTMVAELIPVVQEMADSLCDRLRTRLANEDVTWDWQQEEGPVRALLMRAEALTDLIVLGARDPTTEGKGPSTLAGYMAVHGRAPLLVVPESARSLDLAGPAVVAWNGSCEAGRALRGAIPLLHRAASVTLACVAEDVEDPNSVLPALDAAEYLSHHGIGCEIAALDRRGGSVGQALTDAAAQRGAAYLVMGAYGHSRAVETLFGGVTRELLSDPPLPIFTAH